MEHKNILEDLAGRTNGEVYIGVVGPVRTGKSTLIKRLMETMILPRMEDENEKRRTRDELPQSGDGTAVMTTEPKFVPAEAVELMTPGKQSLHVRLVDCVGYTVEGAGGFMGPEGERMVHTAWKKEPMPFSEAAELGTRKVIEDHSTMALVVTCDGSICDLPRAAYEKPESRVIEELQALKKPFVVVMNTKTPDSPGTRALCEDLRKRTGARVLPMDLKNLTEGEAMELMEEALKEFPLRLLRVYWPEWVDLLPGDHWFGDYLKEKLTGALAGADSVHRLEEACAKIGEVQYLQALEVVRMDMGRGEAELRATEEDGFFHRLLEEITGISLSGPGELMARMQELSDIRRKFGALEEAVLKARTDGYGVVEPALSDMVLKDPEVVPKGTEYCVRLTASAPMLHMIRADVNCEVTPFVGTRDQSEEMARDLKERYENAPDEVWQSNIFGKTLQNIVEEGLGQKRGNIPDPAQQKLQHTLTRIVNEGSGGLICIIY